jgi:hypothetical protein
MPSAPARVRAVRKGRAVVAIAKARRGAELPDGWQYVLRTSGRPIGVFRAKPGTPARFLPRRLQRRLSVRVRPVVRGRVLKTSRTTPVRSS